MLLRFFAEIVLVIVRAHFCQARLAGFGRLFRAALFAVGALPRALRIGQRPLGRAPDALRLALVGAVNTYPLIE